MESLQKIGFPGIVLALFLMGCGEAGNAGIFVSDAIQGKDALAQSLIPVPVHWEYDESSTFAKTEDHLSVFVVYRTGITSKLSLDETEIMLEDTTLVEDTPYSFTSPGEKEVVVSYGTLSARYAIIVRSGVPNGLGPTPSGGTSVDIDIQWE
jgi:hypothetical protein